MKQYAIRNHPLLRRILWLDAFMGISTAVIGLGWTSFLTSWLGLPRQQLFVIALVTLIYGIAATLLATAKQLSVTGVRVLVVANWFWALVSVVLLATDIKTATVFGAIFLVLQVVVVGGLAYLEGRQLTRTGKLP